MALTRTQHLRNTINTLKVVTDVTLPMAYHRFYSVPWDVISVDMEDEWRRYIESKQLAEMQEIQFLTEGKKKQQTRLLKVECEACHYTMRVTRSWLQIGVPVCPNPGCEMHGKEMMHEADATFAEDRVNTYHHTPENSLSRIEKNEGVKIAEKSKRQIKQEKRAADDAAAPKTKRVKPTKENTDKTFGDMDDDIPF